MSRYLQIDRAGKIILLKALQEGILDTYSIEGLSKAPENRVDISALTDAEVKELYRLLKKCK